MSRPYRDRDLTMRQGANGTGVAIGFTRVCVKCNRKRGALGGRTDKRTKMWRCVDCVTPAVSK